MASFVVDITAVRFSATNTGYKDITITGMPQAGVICTITGTNASSFGYRIPGQDQNVYRVYTTGNSNIGVSREAKSATFKITNAGDSTDYVEVSLYQCWYNGSPIVRGVGNVYDNIYAYWEGDFLGAAYLFAEYRSDNVGTYAILYVDGYEGTTTLSENWAYYTADSVYTDTGFKQIKIGASNNYDSSFRSCTITFTGTNSGYSSILYQNAYPSSTAGCTSPIRFSGSGGTERITLKTDGQPAENIDYKDLYSNDGLTYTIVESGSGTLYYDVTVGANQSDKVLRGAILFERWSTHKNYGFALVFQDPSSGPVPTLTVDPSVLTYPSSGGARVLDVTYATSLSTNASLMPSWLGYTSTSIGPSNKTFTISAASNDTSVARNWDFELSDATMAVTVPITQAAGQASSLVISPTSSSVGNTSGSVLITVNAVGISEINYSSTSWISYVGKNGNVYTFNYTANTTTSQRTGTITFSGGGLSATYTLTQAAEDTPSLVVSPTSDSVSSASGTYQVTVTTTNISSVSYSISDNWLSYSSKSGNVYTFSYTENTTSSQRQSVVTFSGGGLTRTFTLSQAGSSSVEMSISPTSDSVGSTSGSVEITVTSSGISSVSYNISGSWITYASKSGNVYTFNYAANSTSSSRTGTITFSGGGLTRTFTLSQAGISSEPITANVDVLRIPNGGYYGTIVITYNGTYTVSKSSWISGISSGSSSGTSNYTYNVGENTDSSDLLRRGYITFTGNNGTSCKIQVFQGGMTYQKNPQIIPKPIVFQAEGGSVYVAVDYYDHLTYTNFPVWITKTIVAGDESGSSPVIYRMTAGANTGNARSKTAIFQGGDSLTLRTTNVTFSQAGGSTPTSISVSPSSVNVGSSSGTVSVTATGADNIQVSVPSGGWLTYTGVSGSTYTFSYTANTGTGSRTTTATFSASGATSASFTLTQAGTSPGPTPGDNSTIKAHPSKLRFYKEGSSILVSFTNRPTAGISYTIIYTDGSGWLSVRGSSGKERYVTASENDGIRRRATIRFYETGNSSNYVDVPVIQGGDGYDSIWLDQMYYPENRDANNNYYYRLVDQDRHSELFVGVSTIPAGRGGEVGGIDIPRLVDNFLGTYFYTRWNNDWAAMYEGFITVDVYNMTESGYPGTVEASFKYWNDWSRFERRYDYTRALNDPINGKGREDMIMPFCVYYGEPGTFNIVETEKNGNVNTYTYATPEYPFSMRIGQFYDVKTLVYRKDDEILFTYDMTHCGPGALIYRNRFGGWDSFLIEGNISKTDNYTKQNFRRKGDYNATYVTNHYGYFVNEKRTIDVDINSTYEAYTGWLTDEEAERLAFHLLSSPVVYFQDFTKTDDEYDTDPLLSLVPVRITASSAEYKKFRNGKRLVNYLITFEKSNTEKVKY